jgi:hypothetical protein
MTINWTSSYFLLHFLMRPPDWCGREAAVVAQEMKEN